MAEVTVKLMRSRISCTPKQRRVLDALGLHRRESVRTFNDNPAIRGMINKVFHLVKVQSGSSALRERLEKDD